MNTSGEGTAHPSTVRREMKVNNLDMVLAVGYPTTTPRAVQFRKWATELDLIVTIYLDYAELQARNRRVMTMADWADRLDAFIQLNEHNLLTHAGKVRADVAQALAEARFEEFDRQPKHDAALADDEADVAAIEAVETA